MDEWIRTGSIVHWLKLPAPKVGNRSFEPRSGIQVSKKQNVSSLFTLRDSILWSRSSEHGLKPPGFEFHFLCLEGNVISFISPFSRGSPDPAESLCVFLHSSMTFPEKIPWHFANRFQIWHVYVFRNLHDLHVLNSPHYHWLLLSLTSRSKCNALYRSTQITVI